MSLKRYTSKSKKKIKVTIIGYGSIGELHLRTLKGFKQIKHFLIITNRNLKKSNKVTFSNNINSIVSFDPDYIIVSTPNSKHYTNFSFLEKKLRNKIILIEKPLFHKYIRIKEKLKNNYFVNYNLRELNLIKYLKMFIKNKHYFNVFIECSSYLPSWRTNIGYRESSSGKKNLGGGVLNDLSHEIDYALSIFGDFKIVYSYTNKISNLDIDTNDFFIALLSNKKKLMKISLNYFSHIPKREIIINAKNFQLNADLLKNSIKIKHEKKKDKFIYFNDSIKNTYTTVHNKILNNELNNLCSIKEAVKVMRYLKKFDGNK